MKTHDERWKDMSNLVAGRRRGSLWRSDRDWLATAGLEKDRHQIRKEMVSQVKAVNRIDATMTNDGWTRTKNMKKIGSIPMNIMLANPELWVDDKACEKFLNDNPKWRVKK